MKHKARRHGIRVGDLVTMEKDLKGKIVFSGIGVVVSTDKPLNGRDRIAVFWSDGDGIDWEPRKWLEVVSESR